jgi:hypothetical protein
LTEGWREPNRRTRADVVPLPTQVPHVPAVERVYEPLDPLDFSHALQEARFDNRVDLTNGVTILNYERVVMARGPDGTCIVMSVYGADPSVYYRPPPVTDEATA